MMKQLDLREILKTPDFSKIFIGRILKVDTGNMILSIEFQNVPGVVNVGVPFQYLSDISGAYSVYVPIEGDTVIMGATPGGDWEILGYRMGYLKHASTGRSVWADMRKSDEYIKPMELQKGDFGQAVYSKDNSVEFFMLGDGRLILSAGLVYMLFSQAENSLKQVMAHCVWDSGKMTQHWGEARIVKGGKEQVVKDQRLWRVKDSDKDEEIAMGYVNDNGTVETSTNNADLRFKLKIGDTEVLIDKDGGVEIKTQKNIYIDVEKTGENIKIENGEVNVKANKVNIKAETKQEGDLTVQGDVDLTGDMSQTGKMDRSGDLSNVGRVSVSGNTTLMGTLTVSGNVTLSSKITCMSGGEIGGIMPVVLSTILALLKNHTHQYMMPMHTSGTAQTETSTGLAMAEMHKTTNFKAG